MTTYYAAHHDGHSFTRSTAGRAYTHMVVAVYDIAKERLEAERRARAEWKRDLAYLTNVATASPGVPATFYEHNRSYTFTYDKLQISKAQEEFIKGEAGAVADALKRFDSSKFWLSADGKQFYCDAGWCGRPDLAQKLQSATMKHAVHALILEANEVSPVDYRRYKAKAKQP